MKYKEWLEEWLETFVKPTSKIRTYDRYRELAKHLTIRLGEKDIGDLSPIILQKTVTDMLTNGNLLTKDGLSPNTVNGVITIMQSSLKTAFSMGLTDTYSADKIKRPQTKEKRVECFTHYEQKRMEGAVLNSSKPHLIGVLICLYTGLRIGELLALEWKDVNLVKRIITINRSCHYGRDNTGNYGRITDTPKTNDSIRVIPIPKQLVPILKKHKALGMDHVITYDGRPMSVRSYQRTFELLQKKLSIPRRRFHALRHTFATRALECGMDVKTLSEILGHKNPTVTLNRYVHSLMEHKKEMMDRIGKLL